MVLRVARRTEVFSTLDAATARLSRRIARRASESVRARGRFVLVISGGRTPLGLFERLGGREYQDLPWARTEVFFADERCVDPRSSESNFRSAWDPFLSRVPIPRHRVHRMRGELRPPRVAAERYARQVGPTEDGAGPAGCRFDLVLLGIGPDGHTASLFPESSALRETRRSVVAVPRAGLAPFVPRITMTPRALASSEDLCFLVAGSDKAEAVAGIFRASGRGDPRLPASCVRPRTPATWFLDRAAAARLPRGAG